MTSQYSNWVLRKYIKDNIATYGHRFSTLFYQIKNTKRKITNLCQQLYKYNVFKQYHYIPKYLQLRNNFIFNNYSRYYQRVQSNFYYFYLQQIKQKIKNLKLYLHHLLNLYSRNFPYEDNCNMLKLLNSYTVHLDILFFKKMQKTKLWLGNKYCPLYSNNSVRNNCTNNIKLVQTYQNMEYPSSCSQNPVPPPPPALPFSYNHDGVFNYNNPTTHDVCPIDYHTSGQDGVLLSSQHLLSSVAPPPPPYSLPISPNNNTVVQFIHSESNNNFENKKTLIYFDNPSIIRDYKSLQSSVLKTNINALPFNMLISKFAYLFQNYLIHFIKYYSLVYDTSLTNFKLPISHKYNYFSRYQFSDILKLNLVPPYPPYPYSYPLCNKLIANDHISCNFCNNLYYLSLSAQFFIIVYNVLFLKPPPFASHSPSLVPTNFVPKLSILAHSKSIIFLQCFLNVYLQYINFFVYNYDSITNNFTNQLPPSPSPSPLYLKYLYNNFFKYYFHFIFQNDLYFNINNNFHSSLDLSQSFINCPFSNFSLNNSKFAIHRSFNIFEFDLPLHFFNLSTIIDKKPQQSCDSLLSLSPSSPPPLPSITNQLVSKFNNKYILEVDQIINTNNFSTDIETYNLNNNAIDDKQQYVPIGVMSDPPNLDTHQTIPKSIDDDFVHNHNIVLPLQYSSINNSITLSDNNPINQPTLHPQPIFQDFTIKSLLPDVRNFDNSNSIAFLNKTNIEFSSSQLDLLSKGPKATYAPPPPNNSEMRNYQLLFYSEVEYILRHITMDKPNINQDINNLINVEQIKNLSQMFYRSFAIPQQTNLQQQQFKNLLQIKKTLNLNNALIILADKSNTLVAINKNDYLLGMSEALTKNNFKLIKKDLGLNRSTKLKKLLLELNKNKTISDSTYKHLYPVSHKPCNIYGRFKSHKTQGGYRPLVDTSASYISSTSKWLLSFLKDYSHMTYNVKNSNDFISKIRGINIDVNTHLMSLDVESMYGSINLDLSIDLIIHRYRMDECKRVELSIRDLVYLLDLCTKQITCLFDGQFFSQVGGILMGHPLGGLMADIHISVIENKVMEMLDIGMRTDISILSIYRYADDLILLINNITSAQTILDLFNGIDHTIKFTKEDAVDDSINFLDITLIKCHNKLEYKLFRKPSQNNVIIDFASQYPYSIKLNILKQDILRAYRLCSNEYFLNKELKYIESLFLANNYPQRLIKNMINRVGADWVNRFRLHPYSTSFHHPLPPHSQLLPTFHNNPDHNQISLNHDFNKIEYLHNIFYLQKSFQYIIHPNSPPIDKSNNIYLKIDNIFFYNILNPLFNLVKYNFYSYFPFLNNLNLVAQSPPTLKQFFDRLKNLGEGAQVTYDPASVIYHFVCACAESYIGNTSRQFSLRMREHMMYDRCSKIKIHLQKFACQINTSNFKIIYKQNNNTKRNILESLLIRSQAPTLNVSRGWDLISHIT